MHERKALLFLFDVFFCILWCNPMLHIDNKLSLNLCNQSTRQIILVQLLEKQKIHVIVGYKEILS